MANLTLQPVTRADLEQKLRHRQATDPQAWVDLTHCELIDPDLKGMDFHRVRFSSFRADQCRSLRNIRFDGASFDDCSFWGADLQAVSFRGARRIYGCDFRNVCFRNCTFTSATLELCDLYRASFGENNVFERARLKHCSLHLTALGGANIPREGLRDGVVQQYPEAFTAFHGHFQSVPVEQIPHYVALGKKEAAAVWRELSGVWAGRGFYGDATAAYVTAKRLERSCRSPWFIWQAAKHEAALRDQKANPDALERALERSKIIKADRRPARLLGSGLEYLNLWFLDLTCGFGSSLFRVASSLVAAVAIFFGMYLLIAIVFHVPIAPGTPATWQQCLSFALFGKLQDQSQTTLLFSTLYTVESAVEVALIGIFGFVLGNVIRSN